MTRPTRTLFPKAGNETSHTKKPKKIPIPLAFGDEPVIIDLADLAEFKAKFGLRTVAIEWPQGAACPVLHVENIQSVKE